MNENDPVTDEGGQWPSETEFADGSRLDLLVLLRRRARSVTPRAASLCVGVRFAAQRAPSHGFLDSWRALAAQADDWRDWEAYDMAETGVLGLVLKLPEKQEEARVWHAQRHGYDPTQDAISIFDLSAVVEKAAKLHPLTDPLLESKEHPVVVRQLRDYLIQRFGEGSCVGPAGEDWISRYGASVRKSTNNQRASSLASCITDAF